MKLKHLLGLAAAIATVTLTSPNALAQGRPGGPGGNWDPEQMRERMTQMMKERLNISDEEWKIIQPRLEKVQEAQASSRGGRFGGMGAFGGRNRGGDQQADRPQRGGQRADRPGSDAMQALRDALEDEKTPASELKAKMQAVREARKKADADLKSAREELRQVLTTRQEAACVMMGLLD